MFLLSHGQQILKNWKFVWTPFVTGATFHTYPLALIYKYRLWCSHFVTPISIFLFASPQFILNFLDHFSKLLEIITMGVFTYETEYASVIPPARLYNALVLDADNLIPKIAPQAIKTAEILEGDGGVGTIKKISFGEGSEYSYVKHKVDGIDKDNFVYSYSLIEGDAISETIEKISYEIKLVASGSGSTIKNISHYHTKGDVEIKEEHVKAGKERAHGLFKLIENYLAANPGAYN